MSLSAQRTDFVFHVYVDPLFGDNQKALELNPTNPHDVTLDFVSNGRPLPLDTHPDMSTGPGGTGQRIEGFLQHAPYSFKTLSSPSGDIGAVEYVQRLFVPPQPNPNPVPTLPWAHPQGNRRVTHVVIHCLPGLYGPVTIGGPNPPDPASGLPWNGEQFPIELGTMPFDLLDVPATDRISIQGTSALDTIFDARGGPGPVFEIGLPDPTLYTYLRAHGEAFIDGVTVRGALSNGVGASGAGVHIRGRDENHVAITNCMIVENSVGIAVNSDHIIIGTLAYEGEHQPRIVSNTIANNVIGYWQGDLDDSKNQILNTPALLNNLFAFGVSSPLVPLSCFEGVYPGDLTVGTAGPGTNPPAIGVAYNAWDPSSANLGPTSPLPVSNFPLSPVSVAMPAPRVDTGDWDLLFIRDIFDAAGFGAPGAPYSPHDYRLSPNSRPISSPNPLPTVRNPLVDTALAVTPVTMVNGVSMPAIGPGLPAGAEEVDMAARDWDAEGFGNPRVFLRDDHPDPLVEFEGMDFGADEVGNLIVAGYLPSTRIFSVRHTPVATTLTDHLDIYFFDALPAGVLHPRPNYNSISSFEFGWYDHVLNKPDVPAGQMHDYVQDGVVGSARHALSMFFMAPAKLEPFMRNLQCDVSPHLALDLHPFWPDLMDQLFSGFAVDDAYACNPWYSHTNAPGSFPPQPDNPSLYHSKGPLTPSTGYSAYAGNDTFVATSAVNPPFTMPLTAFNVSRLFPFGSVFTSTAGGSGCPSGAVDYAVDGFGMSACPDRINPFGAFGQGTRFNLESVEDGDRNIQTFLLIPAITILDPEAGQEREALQPSQEDLRDRVRLSRRRRR